MLAFSRIGALVACALLATAGSASAQCSPSSNDLNQKYTADDGATYYISQYGPDIWWIGMSGNDGKNFTNVFKGKLSRNIIRGQWADIAIGETHNHGNIHLFVSRDKTVLKKTYSDGGFTGTTWTLANACNDSTLVR